MELNSIGGSRWWWWFDDLPLFVMISTLLQFLWKASWEFTGVPGYQGFDVQLYDHMVYEITRDCPFFENSALITSYGGPFSPKQTLNCQILNVVVTLRLYQEWASPAFTYPAFGETCPEQKTPVEKINRPARVGCFCSGFSTTGYMDLYTWIYLCRLPFLSLEDDPRMQRHRRVFLFSSLECSCECGFETRQMGQMGYDSKKHVNRNMILYGCKAKGNRIIWSLGYVVRMFKHEGSARCWQHVQTRCHKATIVDHSSTSLCSTRHCQVWNFWDGLVIQIHNDTCTPCPIHKLFQPGSPCHSSFRGGIPGVKKERFDEAMNVRPWWECLMTLIRCHFSGLLMNLNGF